ncbi:beta-ketoacyl synthase N-terminal-like domain-containing protein [Streptomyces sp. NPDC047999]|uniref:beta-ketoacyl synthase N-terminal-like domain-containing protein n=1 Tax=Streptomyces sp. NPDC047999 TaxID=3365497 RepID=UPI0037189808
MTRRPARRALVTGAGVRTAVATGPAQFAAALREGRCGIALTEGAGPGDPAGLARLPDSAEDPDRLPAELPAELGRRARRAAARAPREVRAAVLTALEAWCGAGLHRTPAPEDRVALVVAGHNLTGGYAEQVRPRAAAGRGHVPASAALRLLDTDHLGTLSEVLGTTGPGCTVGGASASGTVGLISAVRMLAMGEADVCLVVGALSPLTALERQALVNLGAMATGAVPGTEPPGPPFDRRARGFLPGEGCAALVLESPRSAARRSVPPLAAVEGYGLRLGATALARPDERIAAAVMTEALRTAGREPREVRYVSAHATGTPLGDSTEAAALRRVFGEGADAPWVNATKSLTGHCLHAAGVVEAVATVVQMREGFVHPNPGLTRPLAGTGLRLSGAVAETADLPYAVSNSFGFGGIAGSLLFSRDPR